MKKIPVYLFLGFLESGKTTLIQKTLANKRFGNGENILLLVCEEGLEEYDLSKLKQNNITLHVMEESTELEESSLLKLSDECGADRVVIEYNGMWHLNDLLMNKPENPADLPDGLCSRCFNDSHVFTKLPQSCGG